MITRVLYNKEKDEYNKVVKHPLQTWEWGDFQITQGHKVYRLGIFDNDKMIGGYSVSFHKIPKFNYSVGTILRGPATTLVADVDFPNLHVSPKVAFYPFSYVIDLTKSEDDLLAAMHSKTRYNIKTANRHEVKIEEATNHQGFDTYLKLLFDTTKRQGFYLHSESYHRQLWKTLLPTGIPHIMLASYQGQVLSATMLFVLKDKLFYPYGASLDTHREVMAPTLLMWECIKFGKSQKLKSFDMWGSLGPDAKETDQGFGFHKFKQGYGGQLVQFVGTYDLVINQNLYKVYNLVDKYRWQALRLKAKLSFLDRLL